MTDRIVEPELGDEFAMHRGFLGERIGSFGQLLHFGCILLRGLVHRLHFRRGGDRIHMVDDISTDT